MGSGASKTDMVMESRGGESYASDEAFYQEHREELLEMLRSGHKLQPRGEAGVGLLNQGATCYMNSLLQALFNIPEFRLAVYSFEHTEELHGEASRCIPLQLQRLFAALQLSSASACSTKELTAACGFTGRDAMEQHDVQELCRVLFDALERSSSMLAEVIRELYSGKMTNYTRCNEDRGRVYESKRPASYMDLQVPIQDCKSLGEALSKITEPSLLSGDNQWFCEDLGEKVDALSGTSIDSVPNILCLQLLRFVFDLQLMRRKKLSDQLAIPLQLDLSFWGAESYQLCAVCLHSGTAQGGHYHAFIRDLYSGVWKDANDSRVEIIQQKQSEALFAEGGSMLYSSDAYFLLYRKSGMQAPRWQDLVVPHRLSAEILVENQRLKVLQRVYELHRQLTEVKVFCSANDLMRRFVARQLSGLVSEVETEERFVAFTTLEPQPEKIQEKAVKAISELNADWAKGLALPALRVAKLRHFDPQRGLAGSVLQQPKPQLDLILDIKGGTEVVEGGDALFFLLWAATEMSLAADCVAALPFSQDHEATEEVHECHDSEEVQELFAQESVVRPASSRLLGELRQAISSRWNLKADDLALVALTGMQAGQELTDDGATLRESGLSPDDVISVEPRPAAGPCRAVQLYEQKKNTALIYFNHPDRPGYTEEFPAVAASKDSSLAELKALLATQLQLDKSQLHLAKSQHAPAMFKDETRSLRQAGLCDTDSVFVGYGAPCNPEESMLKVSRYAYENGSHKVSDVFSFPARGDMSVRSLKEALVKVCQASWALEVTWKRLRLRDGQAGKHFAVLRDQRTLRSALLGFADGRQVAVQILQEEEELGADDMIVMVRPWRVAEGRLHSATELVVSRNQSLLHFQEKLHERFKGLLTDMANKENQPKEASDQDFLEICAAPVTGPVLTVKRCESLKWSESRLSGDDRPLCDCKELRDGVTVIIRSRLAALSPPKPVQAEGKGGKGPGKAPGAKGVQNQAAEKARAWREPTAAVPVAREKGLVIKVSHPEAD